MRHGFASEVELARPVVEWLRSDGYEVFQEVEHLGDIADIVAKRGDCLHVVECKLAVNLEVLYQGHRWIDRAHRVSIAVPLYGSRAVEARHMASVICRKLGLGMIEVSRRFDDSVRVDVAIDAVEREPAFHHRSLASVLHEEQKTFAEAGSATGVRWTDFKATERALVALVAERPGIVARDALRLVPHHWHGDPTATCVRRIRQGLLRGLRVEVDTSQKRGQQVRLYPAEAS